MHESEDEESMEFETAIYNNYRCCLTVRLRRLNYNCDAECQTDKEFAELTKKGILK